MNENRQGCAAALYLAILGLVAVVLGTYLAFEKMTPEAISQTVTRFQDFVLFVVFLFVLLLVLRLAVRRSEPSLPPPVAQQPHYPPVIVVGGQLPNQIPPALPDYGSFRDRYGADYEEPLVPRRWQAVAPHVIGEEDDFLVQTGLPAAAPVCAGRRAGRRAELWLDEGKLVEDEAASEPFRTEADTIADFVADWCRQDGGWTGATELYEAYCEYCTDGDWQPASQTRFGRELGAMGVPKRRAASGGFMYGLAPDV